MIALRIFGIILLGSFALLSSAQQLSLADAVTLTEERNLRLQSQKRSSNASEYNYKAEKLNYLPTLSLVGGFTHLSQELQIDLGSVQESFVDGLSNQQVSTLDLVNQEVNGVPLTETQKQTIYKNSSTVLNELYPDFNARVAYQDYFMASIVLTQPLFMGGKLRGLNTIASSQYDITKQLYQQTNDLVLERAIVQYFTIVLFKEVVLTRQSSVNAMQKHAFNTAKLVEQEIIPAYHELGAKAALSGAETRLTVANNDLNTAFTAYKNLLNLPSDTIIELSSKLKYLTLNLNEELIIQQSLNYSPILKINSANQQIAKQNTSMAKSGYLPNIFAIGELQLFQNNLPVITPPWMVGVQMKWDIYSGNRNINKTRAAKLMEEEATISNQLIANDIKLKIQNSYNKAKNTQSIYEHESQTLELTRASYNAIQKQYSHGLINSSEVVDASLLVEEAQLAQLTALYTYYIARNYSGTKLATNLRLLKTFAPFLMAVSITERMIAKSMALL